MAKSAAATLTKAFNDFYDYITEQDIIKAAHEYSTKSVYKEALKQLHDGVIELIGPDEDEDNFRADEFVSQARADHYIPVVNRNIAKAALRTEVDAYFGRQE